MATRALFLALLAALAAAGDPPRPEFGVAAEIVALRDVRVPAEVAGRVVTRPEDESKTVRKGEVVVALDDAFLEAISRAAEASAERAKARREWAKLEDERAQELFARESINKATVDKAQLTLREAAATYLSAEATAQEAKRRLERTRIRAPFDGKLVRVYAERGEYVRIGETAFRIIDDTAFRIITYIPARYVTRVEVGQELIVSAEKPDKRLPSFRAKVFSIASAAEGAARTFRIEARAPRPKGRWRPGMTALLSATAN